MSPFSEPILHVDMDAFFVEVERLRNPALRNVPVAVGATGGRGVVASASYEARRHGVHSAMPMAEARRRVPALRVVAPDHREYRRVSERLFDLLRGFTPAVEGVSVDEAYLDVSGLKLHFPSAGAIGTEIRARLRADLGLPASVGIGSNKLIAKLASESAKPDGIKLIPLSDQRHFLDPLPVTALPGVGNATSAALERLGVATVGDLAGMPASLLERTLGHAVAEHLADMAKGVDRRVVVPETEARSISSEETFETDIHNRSEIEARLSVQVDRLASRVRRSGLVGRTVTVKLRLADFTTLSRSLTIERPTSSTATIEKAAQGLLARIDIGSAGARLVGVGMSELSDASEPRQLTLGEDERSKRLEKTIDEIRDRFDSRDVIETGRGIGPEESCS